MGLYEDLVAEAVFDAPCQDSAADTVVANLQGDDFALDGGDNTEDLDVVGPTAWAPSALQLDGVNDYIDCGTLAALQGGTSISFSGWLRIDSSPAPGDRVIEIEDVVYVFINGGKVNVLREGVAAAAGAAYTIGEWLHFVATVATDGTHRMYINGELADERSAAAATLATAAHTAQIGARRSSSESPPSALSPITVAHLRGHDRELTAPEAAALYAGPTPPDPSFAHTFAGRESEVVAANPAPELPGSVAALYDATQSGGSDTELADQSGNGWDMAYGAAAPAMETHNGRQCLTFAQAVTDYLTSANPGGASFFDDPTENYAFIIAGTVTGKSTANNGCLFGTIDLRRCIRVTNSYLMQEISGPVLLSTGNRYDDGEAPELVTFQRNGTAARSRQFAGSGNWGDSGLANGAQVGWDVAETTNEVNNANGDLVLNEGQHGYKFFGAIILEDPTDAEVDAAVGWALNRWILPGTADDPVVVYQGDSTVEVDTAFTDRTPGWNHALHSDHLDAATWGQNHALGGRRIIRGVGDSIGEMDSDDDIVYDAVIKQLALTGRVVYYTLMIGTNDVADDDEEPEGGPAAVVTACETWATRVAALGCVPVWLGCCPDHQGDASGTGRNKVSVDVRDRCRSGDNDFVGAIDALEFDAYWHWTAQANTTAPALMDDFTHPNTAGNADIAAKFSPSFLAMAAGVIGSGPADLGAESLWNGDANGDDTGDLDDAIGDRDATANGVVTYTDPPAGFAGKAFALGARAASFNVGELSDGEDLSIAGWVRFTGGPTDANEHTFFSDFKTSPSHNGLAIRYDPADGEWDVLVSAGSPAVTLSFADDSVEDGEWHSILYTQSDSMVRFYLDGAEIGSGQAFGTRPSSTGGEGSIGRALHTGGDGWAGDLYAPAVFRRVLTGSEAVALHAGPPPPTATGARRLRRRRIVHSGQDAEMLKRNTAGQKLTVLALDETGAAVTGDASAITCKVAKDHGSRTALDDTNPTETEAGRYVFDLTQAETDAAVLTFYPVSATDGVTVDVLGGADGATNDLDATAVQSAAAAALTAYDPPTRTEATADKDEVTAAIAAAEPNPGVYAS